MVVLLGQDVASAIIGKSGHCIELCLSTKTLERKVVHYACHIVVMWHFFFVTCLFREYGKVSPEKSKIRKFEKSKKTNQARKLENSKIQKMQKNARKIENSKIQKKTRENPKKRKFEPPESISK